MRCPSDISPLIAGVASVVDGDDGGDLLFADHLFQFAAGSLRHEEALDAVVQIDADRVLKLVRLLAPDRNRRVP